ncbi:1-aminocyclopropane-1-carboxylate deaminase/D-cysteine desulfhydrase [Flagellimonas myxillae]|uniref:1-aminocyclopropane-1-carboxylate deaminase/D-cysteine desulfhydrase n=1 Tax=Flagellimonas myxillae TaxID=2942214 RepID=UPI00201FA566|nr:pyridoxal-phosphate dependent enzyme [Muricauda myxillae]MCL6267810.1 pyridoxal-phosphate dependent enzyme [Muricauda myxillae]
MLIPNQKIDLPLLKESGITLYVKREDTIHPHISGNKYRKLKYNLVEAKRQGHDTLLTFGGAFSNHIAATAYAAKEAGLKTIGVIRGEELTEKWQENPTLKQASEHGMQFHFVPRDAYREKTSPDFVKNLEDKLGKFYLVQEGGTNALAIKGCEEILTEEDGNIDFICCAVGTGGTLSGIINSANAHQTVLGFPALKGGFLRGEISKFTQNNNWDIISDYHFGGYAKINSELVDFINNFKKKTGIPLDPVYTGKMLFGIFDLINKGFFKSGTQILAIHTGGLQGIKGMNEVLKRKNLPLLDL